MQLYGDGQPYFVTECEKVLYEAWETQRLSRFQMLKTPMATSFLRHELNRKQEEREKKARGREDTEKPLEIILFGPISVVGEFSGTQFVGGTDGWNRGSSERASFTPHDYFEPLKCLCK